MSYSQLETPVWDGSVEVDIVGMKEFSEGNLINIDECAAYIFVGYYRQVGSITF